MPPKDSVFRAIAGEKAETYIQIRLTPTEKGELHRLAVQSGNTMAGYLKQLLHDAIEKDGKKG